MIIVLLKEQQRAADAENRARELAIAHEVKVSNLETRLTELSNSISVYDKIRHEDELTIQSLKVCYVFVYLHILHVVLSSVIVQFKNKMFEYTKIS